MKISELNQLIREVIQSDNSYIKKIKKSFESLIINDVQLSPGDYSFDIRETKTTLRCEVKIKEFPNDYDDINSIIDAIGNIIEIELHIPNTKFNLIPKSNNIISCEFNK